MTDVIGLKEKVRPRVDFDLSLFEKAIERSPRFVWDHMALCPCSDSNSQTQQPDPNCDECHGTGFYWYGPSGYVVDETKTGSLTQAQLAVQQKHGGSIIRGFMTQARDSVTSPQLKGNAYDTLGGWQWGRLRVTVRPENHLGYYDRLTNLDSEIVYTQLADMPSSGNTLTLRYPAIGVDLIKSVSTRYVVDQDFTVTAGNIVFRAGVAPDGGTRLSVNYRCHPTWLITTYPHAVRATSVIRKQKRPLITPGVGNPQNLPIQAEVELEFEHMDSST